MWHAIKSSEGTEASSNASSRPEISMAERQSAVCILEYEVFLSFRGPEVRRSFADCLYSCLVRSKIRTFRDEEDLCKGDLLEPSLVQAITESKIYIPILTKSYASSKWCLQELAKMVECWKGQKGHIILPIFYFLEPRDVRHQTGPYEKPFEEHSKTHDSITIQEWRTALQEVGRMKGWHITELDRQGAVIDEVFSKVELLLRSNYALVTEELVGIDFHVQEVMRLLNLDSGNGKIVGIHGIGGMGKTTIAKAVYDNICTNFNRCCFLGNTRETLSKNDGIILLQNKVISSILRDDVQVKDASDGVNIIRERVCKYKVLVVLDDVDDSFEFGHTLGKLDNFSSGSRFIITTRDRRVLEFFNEYNLYEPEEMSHGHSLQLFSKHAFGLHCPLEGYATLCDEFIKVAARLPLALKVLGSLLFRRDKAFWEEKLIELKEVPATSNKVQQRLKISYNELTHNEKQIFLDIACFFIGEDKELPFHMWSESKFYPESGIRTLILRSLIKTDERNRLWMHDLLRDLGRAIVIEEDVKHPFKRSRIWTDQDAFDMFENREGSDRVEMLKGSYLRLTEKAFKKLSRLRYLDVTDSFLTGDFREILPDLRWLRLSNCWFIPTDLSLKNVVILDLQDCSVTNDWRGWSRVKVANKLKVINLKGCHKLYRVPDFSHCGSLELIDLTGCFGMTGELGIGSFRNLKVIRLQKTEITLTGDMGKLQKLLEIKTGISAWGAEEVPVLPTSLRHLTMSSHRVPNLLELNDLEELCFENCSDAPELPGHIWELPKLKTLKMSWCGFSGSLLLDQDGALPSSLSCLIIDSCPELIRLPDLGNLNNLAKLQLFRTSVREIHGLGDLRMLEALEVSECSTLDNLCGLENLMHLKELTLENCGGLKGLLSLASFINLHKLVIIKCPFLRKIQCLGGELSRSLLHLEVSGCDVLENIEGLEYLEALESLTWGSVKQPRHYWSYKQLMMALDEDEDTPQSCTQCYSSFKQFPDISSLQNLKKLYITGWGQLHEIVGIERLNSLKSLVVAACKSLVRLPDLSGLENLENLTVTGCMQLVGVTGLGRLESLRELNMSCCWSLEEFPDISGLKNLKFLDVSNCRELVNATGFEKLENLRELDMSDCWSINELPDMSGLKNLTNINLKGCWQLKKVTGLEKLDRLLVADMDKRLEMKHVLKFLLRQKKRHFLKSVVQYGKYLARSVRKDGGSDSEID